MWFFKECDLFITTDRAGRFLHYPFFRVHVSFIIKIRGSGTGPGYPPGRVFCVAVAGNARYMSSEGILAMTGRDKFAFAAPPPPNHIGLKRGTRSYKTQVLPLEGVGWRSSSSEVLQPTAISRYVTLTQWHTDISVSVIYTSHDTGLGVHDDRPDPRCI